MPTPIYDVIVVGAGLFVVVVPSARQVFPVEDQANFTALLLHLLELDDPAS